MDINSSNLNQITYFNYDQIYYKYLNIIYIFNDSGQVWKSNNQIGIQNKNI